MPEPNSFEIVGEIPFSEVERQLRGITLLNQPDVHPYEDAEIFLQEFGWDDVLPTSKYVLSRQLAVQRAIRASIAPHGFDQLELESGLIVVGGEKGQQGLIPPIVERFFEPDRPGTVRPYIIDGSHRTNLGRMEDRKGFLAVFVSGIRSDCPPYAFPNRWEEVEERTELPEDRATWKNYRGDVTRGEQYALYRDYSPINGSTPRADNK
jgi:hypothetical protein